MKKKRMQMSKKYYRVLYEEKKDNKKMLKRFDKKERNMLRFILSFGTANKKLKMLKKI